jgi:hypothetical protein
MEQIKITSGSMVVIASGIVTAFKNNPIMIKIGSDNNFINIIFLFEETDDQSQATIKGDAYD